jgi:hypothetical protein
MRKNVLILVMVSVMVITTGCIGPSSNPSVNNPDNFTQGESRTTQTDVSVEESDGMITYTLTDLDDRTERVVVENDVDDEVYHTFNSVGDSYSINSSQRHVVMVYQGEKEILLESHFG